MPQEVLLKTYPTIACCGLDCGLCPRYYIKGPSKCPGCCGPDFFDKHPSCSIITCCVKKHKFKTCADCNEFPCQKLRGWDKVDSFICHRVSLTNLHSIKSGGIEKFFKQQERRIKFLENMLGIYNDGRSKSYFCLAAALLPLDDMEDALNRSNEQLKREGIDIKDLKARSNILKSYCNQYALKRNIELRLRKR